MSAVHNPIEGYVLGNGAQEQERLKLQGRFLEKWTEQFLLAAGLGPGMSVSRSRPRNGRCFAACGQARWTVWAHDHRSRVHCRSAQQS